MGEYLYISADNHLDSRWLPKDLWLKRAAAKFRDRAPQVVETDKGSVWTWEGKARGEAADGSNHARLVKRFFSKADVKPGELPPSDPRIILEHLDISKVYTGVFYGDTRKWQIDDPELLKDVYRAYNDFCLEVNSRDRDRIMLLPMLPTALPEVCVAEFQRVVRAGARAVEFGVFDCGKPIFDEAWEPLWEAAAAAKVPLCSHIGDKAGTPYPPNIRGSSLAHFASVPFGIARQIAQFVFCGAFERHPDLNVSIAECRIGWLPFLINWMDRQVEQRDPDPTVKLSKLPSDYVRKNMTFTFEEDYVGARLLREDWAVIRDCVIWGSDYPHEQGTWPDPGESIDKMLNGLPTSLQRDILWNRSQRLFNIKVGKA